MRKWANEQRSKFLTLKKDIFRIAKTIINFDLSNKKVVKLILKKDAGQKNLKTLFFYSKTYKFSYFRIFLLMNSPQERCMTKNPKKYKPIVLQ